MLGVREFKQLGVVDVTDIFVGFQTDEIKRVPADRCIVQPVLAHIVDSAPGIVSVNVRHFPHSPRRKAEALVQQLISLIFERRIKMGRDLFGNLFQFFNGHAKGTTLRFALEQLQCFAIPE